MPDAYGNPELPVTATAVASAWGQAATNRVVATYPTTAARDTEETAPVTGRICYVSGDSALYLFNGTSWVEIALSAAPSVEMSSWALTPSSPLDDAAYAEIASTTRTMPSGWSSAKVLVIAFVHYGDMPDVAQLRAYIDIDGDTGPSSQSSVATNPTSPEVGHPTANVMLVHEHTTSDATIDIKVMARMDNATSDSEDGKYLTASILMVRAS